MNEKCIYAYLKVKIMKNNYIYEIIICYTMKRLELDGTPFRHFN